jgi:hypothetical protein
MDVLTPLPVVDDFVRQYNVGQVLLAVFVVSILGSLPLKSVKLVALNAIVFGFLFLATPASMAPFQYRLLGIGLLVAAPVIYTAAGR